jgi:hypothetical protein
MADEAEEEMKKACQMKGIDPAFSVAMATRTF